jgi:predicted acetyltransferase
VDLEIRPAGPDELGELVRVVEAAFGHHADADDVDEARLVGEIERTLAAFDGGDLVGGTAALSLELTLPGGALAPAAGVTEAGVLPTHRRRGVFTALNARQLDDVAARGEPVAVLTASEATIYGRFGYGPAVMGMSVEIDRAHSAFAAPAPPAAVAGALRVRLLAPEEAALVLPEVFDRYRRARPGEVSRSEGMWEVILRDRERWRNGASALFVAACEDPSGEVPGYVAYRTRPSWEGGVPTFGLEVQEVVALTPAAHAALWRYCLDVDLVRTVSAWNVALDEPLRWLLADLRRLRATRVQDVLWLRVVDVSAALAARRYAGEGTLVLDVDDPFRPATGGRFVLEAGPKGATCRPAGLAAVADLALGVDALGAAYLGGVPLFALARAGRVVELGAGAVERAAALFACRPDPTCITDF